MVIANEPKPKPSPGLQSLEQEVFLNVLQTAGDLEHSLAEGLKPYGLSVTQYNVLRILRGAGPDGLCRNEVGARMLTRVPDVTRLLDRLVTAELVSRQRDEADRRYVTARITERGLAVLRELDEPVAALHRRQLGHMAPTAMRALADLLGEARAGG